jgi:DNA mismatch endonuclease, patch repair protein
MPLPGTPDFAFRREKMAIFIDGCFWHGCPRCYKAPSRNAAFWKKKIVGNRRRDRRVTGELRERGWRVIRLWEHELKSPAKVVSRLQQELSGEIVGQARRKKQP